MTDEELRVLTWTVLGEAAGEGTNGMAAVAHVIRNRSLSGRFPDNPSVVALQGANTRYAQFSAWNAANDGGNNPRARFPVGSASFNKAQRVIQQVFSATPGNDPTRGATHYYSPRGMAGGAQPYWWSSEARRGELRIGGHIFAPRRNDPTPVVPAQSSIRSSGTMPSYGQLQILRNGGPLRLPNLPMSDADTGRMPTRNELEVLRTGAALRLPEIYDPVRGTTVARRTSASDLVRRIGSARTVQRTAAQEYATRIGHSGNRNVDYQRNEQLVETARRAANAQADRGLPGRTRIAGFSVPVGTETTVASISTTTAGSAGANRARERAEQLRTRVRAGVQTQFAQPRSDRLAPSGPGSDRPIAINSGGLSRDATAQRRAGMETRPVVVRPTPADLAWRPAAAPTYAFPAGWGGRPAPVQPRVAPIPMPPIQRPPVVAARPPLEVVVEGSRTITEQIRKPPVAKPEPPRVSVIQAVRNATGMSAASAYEAVASASRDFANNGGGSHGNPFERSID